MHLFTIYTLIAALCASSASANCFQTGQNWGNHEDACNVMKGNYKPGEIFTQCRNAPGFESYEFKITNHNGRTTSVSYDACVSTITREIQNCGHGSEETFGGVTYRGDPNKRKC
ncbi:MAG: hypothetical protein L6R37_007074 [Teloschistes peruensis]|nr:MAG: hypothetical protein L6R37_007074 [Teloschistes peruensis]